MTPQELRALLARLKLTQVHAASLLGVDARTMRKWVLGEAQMTQPATRLLWLCERLPAAVPLLAKWLRARAG
jgi:DNA-binding transcriptional regulator YiaG